MKSLSLITIITALMSCRSEMSIQPNLHSLKPGITFKGTDINWVDIKINQLKSRNLCDLLKEQYIMNGMLHYYPDSNDIQIMITEDEKNETIQELKKYDIYTKDLDIFKNKAVFINFIMESKGYTKKYTYTNRITLFKNKPIHEGFHSKDFYWALETISALSNGKFHQIREEYIILMANDWLYDNRLNTEDRENITDINTTEMDFLWEIIKDTIPESNNSKKDDFINSVRGGPLFGLKTNFISSLWGIYNESDETLP